MLDYKKLILVLVLGMVCGTLTVPAADDPGGSAPASTSDGAASKEQGKTWAPPTFQQRRPRYQVEPGDVLDLNFPFTPEMNQTVTIQPDGYITLRGAGDVYVQGKTTPELQETFRKSYASILHDPVITVDLKDFQKPYFIAGGQVAKPGKYDLRADTTVSEAVEIAGGFTDSSKHSQVLLFRRVSPNYVEVKKLNVKKMMASRDLAEDVYLRPGDMLFVPKNLVSKVRKYLPTQALSLYFNPSNF